MQVQAWRKTAADREAVSSGVPGRGWRSFRKTVDSLWKRKALILALFLLAAAVLSGYHYVVSLRTASTIVSLDYEEASRGLTPSQTRFSIFEIHSDEVMERLIDYAGLQGVVAPDELGDCVSVKATHSRNVRGDVNFISTSFVIGFTIPDQIQRRSAETMLSLLCKAYREFFVEHYGINHSILSFDIHDLKVNDEYLSMVDLLELKCGQLEKYVQLRKRESKNYKDPDSGITFSALEQRVSNFYTYDLARLRAYIIENGIANDKPALSAMLDYKIRMDRLACDQLMAAYEEDNQGIRMYDTAMSAVVMIPTQDQAMQFYMSRTKTGMDRMAVHADGQLQGAAERMERIEYSAYLMAKMNGNAPRAKQFEKVDAMIAQAEASLEKLAADIRMVDNSFASAKAHNYLSFRSVHTDLLDRLAPVASLLTAGILLVLLAACVFLKHLLTNKG